MKRLFLLLLVMVVNISLFAQIENGFYLRLGPSIPVGSFNSDQYVRWDDDYDYDKRLFADPNIGFNFELGCHIYTGKAFAKEKMRIGIDATFFSTSFYVSRYEYDYGYYSSDYKDIYWFLKQKVGPIITFSPMDDMYLDLGVRFVPTIAYLFGDYHDIWGRRINEEILFNFRWNVLMASFQFDIGKINFNNFSGDGYMVYNSTFNLLIGVKF